MINNFYTLRALVEEWRDPLVGTHLIDAFSQEADELTLAFASPDSEQMLRVGTRPPLQFIFRSDGYSKARRNVATLFERAFDRSVQSVCIAERDRMLFFSLEGPLEVRIPLFGSRANVLLVKDGRVVEAFRKNADLAGRDAPQPRAAPSPETSDAFAGRWRSERASVAQAVSSACPIFDRSLGNEVAMRAGIDPNADADVDRRRLDALFEATAAVRNELLHPSPHIYWDGDAPRLFSLIALRHVEGLRPEPFDTVDAAVRVFVRRSLARRRFHELYDPLHDALSEAADHHRTSAERMLEELSRESRADRYERWGHLLMARSSQIEPGADEVELEDLFGDGDIVTVELDPAKSAVENAEAYYERARRTRRSREEAERRLVDTEEHAERAEALLEALRGVDGLDAIRTFRKERADELAHYLPDDSSAKERVPFRRYDVGGGYQVWVGRNARQNDDLTFHHAQKYDLWMHARGVPGSHAVLRLPNRDAEPDRGTIRRAAAIAAYYSKARGSGLVPVMVARRKHVRKPSGAGPGAVAVEHEDVVLVEPRLPDG